MAKVDFHYIKTGTGELSGPSFVTQTELAINELGKYWENIEIDVETANKTANDAKDTAADALNTAADAALKVKTAQASADAAQTTADTALTAANNAQAAADKAQATADGKAPIKHASAKNTYGLGTDTLYGHVLLSDALDNDAGVAATSGTAASSAAVAALYSQVVAVQKGEATNEAAIKKAQAAADEAQSTADTATELAEAAGTAAEKAQTAADEAQDTADANTAALTQVNESLTSVQNTLSSLSLQPDFETVAEAGDADAFAGLYKRVYWTDAASATTNMPTGVSYPVYFWSDRRKDGLGGIQYCLDATQTLYSRSYTGVADAEAETTTWTFGDWVRGAGIISLTESVVWTVTGTKAGAYDTLNSALAFANLYRPATGKETITIKLLAGYVWKEVVHLTEGDYSYVHITAEDDETTVSREAIIAAGYASTGWEGNDRQFTPYCIEGCMGPVMENVALVCDETGTVPTETGYNSCICGPVVKNAGGSATFKSCRFSYFATTRGTYKAGESGLTCEHNAAVTAPDCTFTYNGDNGIVCVYAATVSAPNATCSNNSNGGIWCGNAASVSAQNATCNNNKNGIWCGLAATVSAPSATCSNNSASGIGCVYAASVSAPNATCSNNSGNGIGCGHAATVSAQNATCNNNNDNGIGCAHAATVSAYGATVTGNGYCCGTSEFGRINLYGAKINGMVRVWDAGLVSAHALQSGSSATYSVSTNTWTTSGWINV